MKISKFTVDCLRLQNSEFFWPVHGVLGSSLFVGQLDCSMQTWNTIYIKCKRKCLNYNSSISKDTCKYFILLNIWNKYTVTSKVIFKADYSSNNSGLLLRRLLFNIHLAENMGKK